MPKKLYLLHVHGYIEPQVLHPGLGTWEELAEKAKQVHAEMDQEDDILFWIEVDEAGVPEVNDFASGLFDEEEDSCGSS